jgi:thymidylate kinase
MKVVIDGTIGAGKTTQLGLLESKGWYVRREQIESWPLEEFYKDKVRWGFLLQMAILKTLQPVDTEKHVIYERCMWSSRHVFWPLIRDTVHPIEKECYEYYFDKIAWYPDIYIHLSKDPEIAFTHLKKRQQTGDDAITLEYLQLLDSKYRDIAIPHAKTYIIDANRSEPEIHEEICRILSENELFVDNSFREEV